MNGDTIKLAFQLRSEIPVAKKRAKRRGGTSRDVRELKSMARARTTARDIGRKLGRTEGAVRQKAYAEGVSFNFRARARRRRKKRRHDKPGVDAGLVCLMGAGAFTRRIAL